MDACELERIIIEEVKKALADSGSRSASNSYLDPGMDAPIDSCGCSRSAAPSGAEQTPAAASCGKAPAPVEKSTGPKALLLFSGVREPWDLLCESIQTMRTEGVAIDAFLCGEALIGIKPPDLEALGARVIPCGSPEIEKLRDDMSAYSALMLPFMSRTCAAKMALGITDNDLLNLAYAALAHKLPTFASTEGLSPKSCIRFGNAIPGVQEILDNYRNQLSKMGMKLAPAKETFDEACRVILNKADSSSADLVVDLVTEEEARKLKGPVVKVARGGLLTPLARENLIQRGIEIVIVPQS